MKPIKSKTEAIAKATFDFEHGNPPISGECSEGLKKLYFDTYYKLRTDKRLEHVIEKYGPIK